MQKYLMGVAISFLATVLLVVPAAAELKFKHGLDLMLRHEYYKNFTDFSDENKDNWDLFTIKTSLWGQADFRDNACLYARLTNQNSAFAYFGGASSIYPDKQPDKKSYHYNINEAFFENLYLDINSLMNMPVDLRIGRQDFAGQYGEGFLIMDGTPGDGPRTVYFNAAKASWRVNEKNTVDAICINDPRTDQFLPVINRDKLVNYQTGYKMQGRYLTTSDEQGYVLYWKNKSIKNTDLEGYYIFKRESEEGGAGAYSSEKTTLGTMGSFAKYSFTPYVLRVQAAGQWGTYGKQDRTGLGGYIYLDRDIKEIKRWSPKATLGWFYLSGDNRKTDKQEGWDPVFSRWPWISDLYVFTIASETGICGYWTNMQGIRTIFSLEPTSKSKVTLGYFYSRAVESVPGSAMFSGKSKERGHCPLFRLDYAFNKNAAIFFLAEYFIPGSFYANDDPAMLLKTELQFKF